MIETEKEQLARYINQKSMDMLVFDIDLELIKQQFNGKEKFLPDEDQSRKQALQAMMILEQKVKIHSDQIREATSRYNLLT